MGGKHKQAQRIKNNARPSSSGRSAELLASTSQVSQFSSVKEIRFVPPTLSLLKTEEFDSSVSPAFQLVFKKMNKKDCTTKLKALQEFSDLIASSEAEAVKTILAFWATLYSILATDADHRVREAVHNAHYQIILKDKKMIAPFLKQLIGPWFTSQYDNYPPAASAAFKAFTAAFPPNKIQDCVVFCQNEILTYIHDNLTIKAEISSKHANNDDAEGKFERIIISSLQGYCLYLSTLTDEQIQKCADLNQSIISNSRFLKLATHKTQIIRATFFKVLATLYHKAPFLLGEYHNHVVPVVFNNLDESEPAVVGFVWDAALLIMELGQEWWKHIHVEKNYLSKLRKVLREGGQGNAIVIYPNLLSLLHKLPPSVKIDQFYDTFFENLRLGLKRKSVLSSKSESTAVVTALIECLQYVIMINQENLEFCEKLIKLHLMPTIEWGLKAEQACYRTVFHHVTVLVQYWNRNKNLENYSKFLNLFWTNITSLLEIVTDFDGDIQDLTERQVTLIHSLKSVAKPKEQMKVKFSSNQEESDPNPITEVVPTQIDETYRENLKILVYAVIKSYVREIEEKKLKILVQNLYSLVRLFESREFLLGLSQNLSEDENLLNIFEKLKVWMKISELCSETVVDLAFVLLQYVSDDEKNVILESFLEFCDSDVFAWCVKNAFSHPYNQDLIVQSWLRNPQVGHFLVGCTDSNLTLDCPENLKSLFKLAFSESTNGDLLIDRKTISQMIEKLIVPLKNPKDFSLSIDTCAYLASYATGVIYTENSLLKYGDELLLALFEFCCNNQSDLEFLTEDTQWEINTSWQDVVTTLAKNLSKEELISVVGKFAQLVEKLFLDKTSENTPTNWLIEAVINFIKSVFIVRPLIITDVYCLFFERTFLPTLKNKIEELCLFAEYLRGNLANIPVGEKCEIMEEDILKYFIWVCIKISVLTSPLNPHEEDEDEDSDIKEIIYTVDNTENLCSNFVYDLTLAQSFLDNYKTARYFSKIKQNYEIIFTKTRNIIDKLRIYTGLKEVFATKFNSEKSLWAKAIYLFHLEMMSTDPENVYNEYFRKSTNDLNKLHLNQLFGPQLDFDYISFTSNVFDDVIILRNLLHCDDILVQIAEVFEKIKKHRSKNIPTFLLENIDRDQIETTIEIIRLFSKLIKTQFDNLSRQHWDFGVICLSSWAANAYKHRSFYEDKQVQAFMVAVGDFYVNLCAKINELKTKNVKNSFIEEWDDLFLPNVHLDLAQLWLFLSEQFAAKTSLPLEYHPFLHEFGRISDHLVHKLIFSKENTLPSWSKILKRCANLLVNSSAILQIWGYKMLLVLVPGLIEIDLQSDSSNTPNIRGFTIEQFREVLQQTDSIVDGVLAGFKLGEDSCQVTPFTDSYTYVFAYLLLWGVLLNLCEKSPPELRYQYADWLKNGDYFKTLLGNLFKLMPTEILHYSEGKAKAFTKLFQKEPNLDLNEPCTSEQLEHAVCWIYYLCLSQLPALVRQWWSETETKVTQIVERVTAFYVSPQLCSQELLDVTRHENKFKNMTIKIVPSVREVIAIYTVDEAQMELVITLPHNYPLGGPDVRCSRQIGGPLHKQWLMQLKKYLLHQNGRIWDGLSLWNSSLDKKFDGVEECYICFAVLHPGTYQLPKLTCQTCKKKFHSACLYKWFSTSNKSSCPICRNLF